MSKYKYCFIRSKFLSPDDVHETLESINEEKEPDDNDVDVELEALVEEEEESQKMATIEPPTLIENNSNFTEENPSWTEQNLDP